MLYLLVALMSGYALGTVVQRRRAAYLLCIPVSIGVYLLMKVLVTSFSDEVVQLASPVVLVAALLQAPLLMLGVYLARRKAARGGYKI